MSTSTRPAPKRQAPRRAPARRPDGGRTAGRRPAASNGARTPARPPMDHRIRERRRAVRRAGARRRRRVTFSIVALVAVVGGGFGITRSPLFAITDVRVEGVHAPRQREVLEVARIATGQNLLEADLGDAVARTEALPWVRKAEVRREPPSTVVLDVAPRRPAAIILAAGGSWLVDLDGVVIGRADGSSLPRIEVAAGVVPVPGVQLDDAATRNALELLDALPADVRSSTRRVQAIGEGTVRLWLALAELEDPATFSRGTRVWVRMGTAGDVEEQVTVLRALLGQLRKPTASLPAEIDVRVPSNPVLIP